MKILSFYKESIQDVVFSFISSVLLLFIIKKMPFNFIYAIFSLLLSLYLIYKNQLKEKDKIKSIKAKEFFSILLDNHEKYCSLKLSYEKAERFLISYSEIKTYEEFLDMDSFPSLKEYEKYFLELLQDEKENVSHIKNYRCLIDDINDNVEEEKSSLERNKKLSLLLKSITVLLLMMMTVFRFLLFKNTDYPSIFVDLSLFFTSFIFPSIYLFQYRIKEQK